MCFCPNYPQFNTQADYALLELKNWGLLGFECFDFFPHTNETLSPNNIFAYFYRYIQSAVLLFDRFPLNEIPSNIIMYYLTWSFSSLHYSF